MTYNNGLGTMRHQNREFYRNQAVEKAKERDLISSMNCSSFLGQNSMPDMKFLDNMNRINTVIGNHDIHNSTSDERKSQKL